MSNHFILCHPLLLPSIFPRIRVFSNELVFCIRWPKYWSFSSSIGPSNEYSGLISLDWLVWSSCCWRDSQESSQTPQFKSIHSSGFSRLYGPTFTSIHACWKNQGKKWSYLKRPFPSFIWGPDVLTFENSFQRSVTVYVTEGDICVSSPPPLWSLAWADISLLLDFTCLF